MPTITYTIPAISCLHCLRAIKNEIGALPGIQAVEGRLDTKQITITFEPPATAEQIEAALAGIDYPVKKQE